MDKAQIISEIKRTSSENDGSPLGQRTFERETGIMTSAWRGRYWRNWGDAVREAGFVPQELNQPHDRLFLITKLAELTKKLGRFPTHADAGLERAADKSFPSHHPLTALGSVAERIELVRGFARANPDFAELLAILPEQESSPSDETAGATGNNLTEGFVYLCVLKVGREKRYKVGKAVLVGRRTDQLSIQLPEELELIHTIRTDDAFGIESYWHKRFSSKNTKGEWFILESVR